MNPNQSSGIKTWQWVVTAIVIIIIIIAGFMIFGKSSSTTEQPADNTPSNTTDVSLNAGNKIIMNDQYPGNVVYISSVQLVNAGWVVIHADNAGQPGEIIGSAWANAGISPVKVTLTKSMLDGKTYYAMLHSDDGDKKFNAAKDMPLKDSAGNIIMKIFHASSSVGGELKG